MQSHKAGPQFSEHSSGRQSDSKSDPANLENGHLSRQRSSSQQNTQRHLYLPSECYSCKTEQLLSTT